MNEIHKKALQKNHRLLVNTLDLSGTNVLDLLLQDDVISSGEQEDILARTTQRDQNTRLLFLLKRRGGTKTSFDYFLKALDTYYDFVTSEIKTTVEKVKEVQTISRTLCSHCVLVNNLIPADVSHTLFEEGVISDDDLEQLNNKNIPRTDRVHKLLSLLNETPDQVFDQFCASLEPKYSYIKRGKVNVTIKNFLECSCSDIKEPKNMIECTDDAKAPSCTYNKTHISQLLNSLEMTPEVLTKSSRVTKCEDTTDDHKQDITREKFQYLSKEETMVGRNKTRNVAEHAKSSISSSEVIEATYTGSESGFVFRENTTCITTDGTTKSEAGFIIPGTEEYLQGSFESNKTINSKKRCIHSRRKVPRSSSNVDLETCENAKPANQIVQVVPKTLPNNKKLMRMCTKLWDKLFFLREKGDWGTFNLVSIKAFEMFSSNPDLQVLLYRSEMCVSTFYNNDKEKATDMFQKAMDLLPKTSMPIWHLARLLPLKIELCTRAKEFEEASSLLEQAHQAIITLGPCLSTGAVHFFEAIYLGNILRCTRYGTNSFSSVSKRVKRCFLTAIEHYQQEQFFAIQSFLNQVYLFLALFCLGVYFKNIGYIIVKTQTVAEEDIALAENYLNLFENKCWENSTNWSRMLFFIARGEQHKQRNNFSRCLDYFREARQCADNGKFVEHLDFVEDNIQRIGDKIKEQVLLQESNLQSPEAILQSLSDSSGESGSGED